LVNNYIAINNGVKKNNLDSTMDLDSRVDCLKAEDRIRSNVIDIDKRCVRCFDDVKKIYDAKVNIAKNKRLNGKNIEDPAVFLYLPFFLNLDQCTALINGNYKIVKGDEAVNHYFLGIVDVIYGQLYLLDSLHIEGMYEIFEKIISTWTLSKSYRTKFGTLAEEDFNYWEYRVFGRKHQKDSFCSYYLPLYVEKFARPENVNSICESPECTDEYIMKTYAGKCQDRLKRLMKKKK
jgi:hypothetical protein